MKKLLSLLLIPFAFLLNPSPAFAQSPWGAQCQEQGVATLLGITCVVKNLLTPLPAIIALAALGMLIYAGIQFINAGADTKAYSSAQQAATWAILGVILLSVAWLALVIIEQFTGAAVTKFGVP